MSVPCNLPLGCILELNFLKAVQPQALTIWITYLSTHLPTTLSDVELVTEHNESLHLGSMEAFCDTPLTIRLTTDQKVSTVRIYTFDERMEIDAVLLVSVPLNPVCSACRPVKYRVIRNPPFPRDQQLTRTQKERFYTDTWVEPIGPKLGEYKKDVVLFTMKVKLCTYWNLWKVWVLDTTTFRSLWAACVTLLMNQEAYCV